MEIRVPDITKVHWQLNVAFVSAVFSIFALIYNDKYISFGLLTFAYGVIGTSLLPAIESLYPQNKFRNYLVIQSILTVIWLASCLFAFTKLV